MLLNSVAKAFEWIRWAGAAYLIYLGVKPWRSASQPLAVGLSSVCKTNRFVQGLVITIPNSKSLMFIAAFLLQFIDAARPIEYQLALIVPAFLLTTTVEIQRKVFLTF